MDARPWGDDSVMLHTVDGSGNDILDIPSLGNKTSLPISMAISASCRVHVSQFKNNPNINLYYTDTDSIFVDSPLDLSLISETELGKLKLETISPPCEKQSYFPST